MSRKTGTPMQMHRIVVRFEPGAKLGRKPKLLVDDVPRVRVLLRSDLSLSEIADKLGVTATTVFNFVKRYQLCDLAMRRRAISSSRMEPIA